jgi:L-fuconolactonase
VDRELERLARHPRLVGIRHVLTDDPDAQRMLRDDFNRGIGLLKDHGLAYDLVILEHQLEQAIQLVDRHPAQTFVLDHVGRPRIQPGGSPRWAAQLRELARRPHVVCKLSGLPEGASFRRWSEQDLAPYLDAALEAFGPRRLMFATDWPMCTLACAYARWVEIVEACTVAMSAEERDWVWSKTAEQAYRVGRR